MRLDVSLDETYAIKGLAILMIIIHHFEQSALSLDYLSIFRAFGPVGCSAFFFVSGYRLTKSKKAKNTSYWLSRLLKIWVPFMMANVFYIAYLYDESYNIADLLLYLLGIKLINGHCWFIHSLLALYLGYAIGTRSTKRYHIIFVSVLAGALYTCLTFSPGTISWIAFPLGVIAVEEYRIPHVRLGEVFRAFVLFVFSMSCFIYMKNDFLVNSIWLLGNFVVLIISSALSFLVIRSLISRSQILKYLGKKSMDFYLIHGLSLTIILKYCDGNTYLGMFAFFMLTLLFATLFEYLHKLITKSIIK